MFNLATSRFGTPHLIKLTDLCLLFILTPMMTIRVNVVRVIGDEGRIVNNTPIMGGRIGFRLEIMMSSHAEGETTTSSHSTDDVVALVQYFL